MLSPTALHSTAEGDSCHRVAITGEPPRLPSIISSTRPAASATQHQFALLLHVLHVLLRTQLSAQRPVQRLLEHVGIRVAGVLQDV